MVSKIALEEFPWRDDEDNEWVDLPEARIFADIAVKMSQLEPSISLVADSIEGIEITEERFNTEGCLVEASFVYPENSPYEDALFLMQERFLDEDFPYTNIRMFGVKGQWIEEAQSHEDLFVYKYEARDFFVRWYPKPWYVPGFQIILKE
jgi:hypothetical protein